MKLMNWLGMFMLMLAAAIGFAANGYTDQPKIAGLMYLVMLVLFAFGFALGLDLSLKNLFKFEVKPIFDSETRTVKVDLNCEPFYMNSGRLTIAVEVFIRKNSTPCVEIGDTGLNGSSTVLDGVNRTTANLNAGTLSVRFVDNAFVIGWEEGQTWRPGPANKGGPV